MDLSLMICSTCGVEHSAESLASGVCLICQDDRQYVPEQGQSWVTLGQLQEQGQGLIVELAEKGLWKIQGSPKFGIGQHSLLVQTAEGNLLWDPPAFIDAASIAQISELGGVAAIASSHPHMFGIQLEWSAAFDHAPVYVAEADRAWLRREGAAVRFWSDHEQVLPGVNLIQIGGHFPGSAVAHWSTARGGVLLTGDSIFPVPSGWASFMRSYPNYIPLSPGAVKRIATRVAALEFDRVYGNFGNKLGANGWEVIQRSAERYIDWITGAHDDLT
ncbi:glyoxylase-like metal-dependent hydrolase (beta-lactamase superfamily II) [Psychromicrobium silvestre]|uniref:Glyoxylase-like metal-dependent hydrolase (Beta-lactamase superfamily II) n=1 Tax=Psychromicrobium silvestre TaxID=1645614 RepID=A0A7Y9LSS7_9MICC|nr:MBL fold metallo-hydrolase [Psychromicrobium silvestre]NYE94934.1 glyoxylase-like metal-dependent hydrolase (beta-lactamase superfamily II) [Psychromicrobium silvestre]